MQPCVYVILTLSEWTQTVVRGCPYIRAAHATDISQHLEAFTGYLTEQIDSEEENNDLFLPALK